MDLLHLSIIKWNITKKLYDHLVVTAQLETVLHVTHNVFTLTLRNCNLVLSKTLREVLIQCVRKVAMHLGT
jgi:hypothetical protein